MPVGSIGAVIAGIIAAAVSTATTAVSGVISGVESAEAEATAALEAEEQRKLQEKALDRADRAAGYDRMLKAKEIEAQRETARQGMWMQKKQMEKEEFGKWANRLMMRADHDVAFKDALWNLWGK